MAHGQMAQRGLKGLVLLGIGALAILAGCSGPSGEEGCGGTGDVVSCVDIEDVVPMDQDEATSNVDAFQVDCDDDPDVVDPEPFFDHSAEVTFTNNVAPGAGSAFDVRIESFSVTYRLNSCPPMATGCPPLTGFSGDETFIIPAGGTVTHEFPLVPIRVKEEFEAAGGDPLRPLSYTATYVFTGRTVPFNDGLRLEASTEFTIGNFNNCP
jgi:hypothetical protein